MIDLSKEADAERLLMMRANGAVVVFDSGAYRVYTSLDDYEEIKMREPEDDLGRLLFAEQRDLLLLNLDPAAGPLKAALAERVKHFQHDEDDGPYRPPMLPVRSTFGYSANCDLRHLEFIRRAQVIGLDLTGRDWHAFGWLGSGADEYKAASEYCGRRVICDDIEGVLGEVTLCNTGRNCGYAGLSVTWANGEKTEAVCRGSLIEPRKPGGPLQVNGSLGLGETED